MQTREVRVSTGQSRGVIDISAACGDYLVEVAAGADGLLHIFAPHATAGLLIMELGSGSEADLMDVLDRLLPRDNRWRHRHGSPGHGADHVLPLLTAPSLVVPVVGGQMALGTWQSVAMLDPNADNATRTIRLSFLPG